MRNEDANFEKIELFVNGKMSANDLAEFEQELKSNPDLVREIALFKDMINGAILLGEEAVDEEVKSIHETLKKDGFFESYNENEKVESSVNIRNINSKTKRFKLPRIAVAAVGLFLIGIALFLFKPDSLIGKRQAAFSKNFKAENIEIHELLDDLTARGMATINREKKDSLTTALTFYLDANYNKAKSHLVTYLNRYPSDYFAQLYLGLAHLHLEEYEKARKYLERVCEIQNFEYKDLARWYLAQNYVMLETKGSMEKALLLFTEISKDSNSEFQTEAEIYLDQLD